MAIVFDEVDAVIEPGAGRERAASVAAPAAPAEDAEKLAKLRRELGAIERRKARLRAD